jgi:sigma-B regulation protein RsbU (phosphoserine phosphatase)
MTYYYLSFWLRFFLFLFSITAALFSISNYIKTVKRSFLLFAILLTCFFCKDIFLFYTGFFIPGTTVTGIPIVVKLLLESTLLVLFFWNYSYHVKSSSPFLVTVQVLALLAVSAISISIFFIEDPGGLRLAWNVVLIGYLVFMLLWTIRYQVSYYYKEWIGRGTYFSIIYVAISLLILYYSLSIVFPFLYLPFYAMFSMVSSIMFMLMSYRPFFRLKERYDLTIKENRLILDMINQVSFLLTANREFEEVMKTILTSLNKAIHAHSGALFYYDQEAGVLKAGAVEGMYPPVHPVKGHMKTKTDYIIKKIKATKVAPGETYIGEVAQSREPLILHTGDFDRYPELVESAGGLVELESMLTFPLMLQDQLLGVISVLSEHGRRFSENDIGIMKTFSDQAALTINNVRLYNEFLEKQKTEKELEVAGYIQQNLFPTKNPMLNNLEIYTYCQSAKIMGGDYYDIIDFGNGRTGIFICDVVGKGVPAAMIMVMIRTILRTISREKMAPNKIIEQINKNLFAQSHSQDTFATVFYMLYDDSTRKLFYSNGGHSPLLVYNQEGNEFEVLDTDGLPIGITDESNYGMGQRVLKDNDILVLYTDGITEAKDNKKAFYGEERFQDFIRNNSSKSADEIGNMVIADINKFAEGVDQHDDQTLILIKCSPKAGD